MCTAFYFSILFPINYLQGILPPLTFQHIMFSISAFLFLKGTELGYLLICLNIINKKPIEFRHLFSIFHILSPYVLATIIYIVLMILIALPGILFILISFKANFYSILKAMGFILATAPTIYLSLRLQFYVYFIIESESPIESLRKSMKISTGYTLELFIIQIILAIIFLISLIPCGLGIIFSFPLMYMATTHIYMILKKGCLGPLSNS